jgi:hypothetical protein
VPSKAVLLVASTLTAVLLLAGCAGAEPGASGPGQGASTAASDPLVSTATPLTTTGADASETPIPTTTPPAPATAEAHEAPPAWDACLAAVKAEYPDLPYLDDAWDYQDDDVRDSATGAVVEVRLGHLDDGRVASAFTCEIGGTPEAPSVTRVSPVDI